MSDTVASLQDVLTATREVFAGIGAADATRPTPCSEWNVAELAEHLVTGNRIFAALLRGEEFADFATASRALAPDGASTSLAAYDGAAAELVDAFGAEGALERTITVPFGTIPGEVALHLRITEIIVHGWDLARATGQRLGVPEAVAAAELGFSQQRLTELPPDRAPFAPPRPAPEDAGSLDRLVALLGRDVDWAPR